MGTYRRMTILAGLLAPAVLATTVAVVSSSYIGYDARYHAISNLGTSRAQMANVMNVFGFGLSGLLMSLFGLAFPLVQGVNPRTALACGAWVFTGICFGCLGLWSFPHPYHVEITLYCAVSVSAAVAAGAWTLSQSLRSGWLWLFSAATAVVALDLLAFPLRAGNDFGLQQRLHLAVIGAWMVAAGAALWVIDVRSNLPVYRRPTVPM
jgi:hypothetical membrane protein